MNELEVRAKDTVVDALQEMAFHEANGEGLSYGAGWQLVGEADYLVTYKQPDATNSSVTVARAFGRVRAGLDDIMGFFYADSSEDFLQLSQLWQHKTHDARVLTTLRARGPTTPYSYLGIKYLCSVPAQGLPPRDQVFLEYMGFAQDSKGRTVGFVATLPLDDHEAPELGKLPMRVPRVRVGNVILIRALEQHPGHCAIFTHGSFDMRESSSTMNLYLRKYTESLRDISVLMDSKRISSQQLMDKDSWVPDSLRKSCYVCTKGFGATRHRHHCRLCGEVVCKKCLVMREVMAPLPGGVTGMTKLKVCMFCVQKTRSKSNSTDSSGFGVPSFSSTRSRSPMNHTVTSSMDRESYLSDASSVISFDIGFDIRSPSRRYSQMSVASTIFEREEVPNHDSFKADLYIDTRDMAPSSMGRYAPPSRSAHGSSSYSPMSSRSSRSSSSSGSTNGRFVQPRRMSNLPPPNTPPYAAPPSYPAPPSYQSSVALRRQDSGLSEKANHGAYQFNHIDQSLAEQQEILRRLAIASNNYPQSVDPRRGQY